MSTQRKYSWYYTARLTHSHMGIEVAEIVFQWGYVEDAGKLLADSVRFGDGADMVNWHANRLKGLQADTGDSTYIATSYDRGFTLKMQRNLDSGVGMESWYGTSVSSAELSAEVVSALKKLVGMGDNGCHAIGILKAQPLRHSEAGDAWVVASEPPAFLAPKTASKAA